MVTNQSVFVQKFEQGLQSYLRSELTPIAFCNGEMALYNLILATKLKLGYGVSDSFGVLVPSFTFSGTVNAIVANHLTPVFADVDDSFTLNPDAILKVDDTVKMVIPVAVYGHLPNVDLIGKYALQKGIAVIFDNAPAFGSTRNGKFTHESGFSEIYSFHATKPFTTMEGGCAVTSDPEIWETLCQLRDFGQFEKERGDVSIPGLNSKMQEISAIVGLSNLNRWQDILHRRSEVIQRYDRFFTKYAAAGTLRTLKRNSDDFCTFIYYPIVLKEDADGLIQFLASHSIAARRYYTAVHTLQFYRGKYTEQDLFVTNDIKDRVVALPLHTSMSNDETDYLFTTLETYFDRNQTV